MSSYPSNLELAFSHITLVAHDSALYERTAEFYLNLGLVTIRHVAHDKPQKDTAHQDALVLRESWLHMFASRSENSITLRIILADSCKDQKTADHGSHSIRIGLATPQIKVR